MLERFCLAKAFRELGDELTNPDERVTVPLVGIVEMLGLG